jgi:2-polyprenyl-6-methoxyphenol hydroxylase-like FAD-dependent oxidoreductase
MERHIGIIGAGVAGLHLGLYLRQHGIDATIITDRNPGEIAGMKLMNTVAHHSVTVKRERDLGIARWDEPDLYYNCHHHSFETPQPLRFRGDFAEPSRAIDYRLYLPALMEDFEARGGRIEYRQIGADDVPGIAGRFDMVAVSTGKGALGQMFPHDAANSPFDHPLRLLCVGLYTGVRKTEPNGVTLSVSPGHGELIEIPTLTFGGHSAALLLENVPGGDLEELVRFPYDAKNPKPFIALLLAKLEKHHPTVFDRIDTAAFGLCQPQDLLQGSIVPTVRRTSVDLGEGKLAVAVGDVHCVVDPAMGQGANVSSYAAVALGEEIVADVALDPLFVERVDRKRADRILGASRWTNFMLMPPTPELFGLIVGMAGNQKLCDEFTTNFNFPEKQWAHLASPARIKAWMADYGIGRAN